MTRTESAIRGVFMKSADVSVLRSIPTVWASWKCAATMSDGWSCRRTGSPGTTRRGKSYEALVADASNTPNSTGSSQ